MSDEPKRPLDPDAVRRFLDQCDGTAKRDYSQGRIGPDDDGVLCAAMTTDHAHKRVILQFGKPVTWIGLSATDCERLADELLRRAKEIA